jgi:FlaG/FlaF family flagellin (archaellin)
MVAITVILAAVIGAFVLEIGDQQETAPNTSFDSEQETNFYKARNAVPSGGCIDAGGSPSNWNDHTCINATEVLINHAGGDVVSITQTDVNVEGNASVWGTTRPGSPGTNHRVVPQPDLSKTLGTNDDPGVASGESWRVSTYGGEANGGNYPGYLHGPLPSDENLDKQRVYNSRFPGHPGESTLGKSYWQIKHDGPGGRNRLGNPVEQGNEVRVVWTASSGGKTQTLFKYTVQ